MLVDTPSIAHALFFSVRRPYNSTPGRAETIQVELPAILSMLQDQTKAPYLVDIKAETQKPSLYKSRYFENIYWSIRDGGAPSQHTGCIWVEVVGDNAPLLQTLRSRISTDPHTFAVFSNLTGDGFNLVVRTALIDRQQHDHYGKAWLQYLQQVYQCHTLPVQLSLQEPSALCSLGIDQQAYFNPSSTIFPLTQIGAASGDQNGLRGDTFGELMTAYTHLLASAQVGLADPLAPPRTCLLLQGDGQPTILGTLGKLGVILEHGRRPSPLVQPIIASALGSVSGAHGLVARCPPGRPTILLLDTGRSPYRLQQFSRQLASLTGQPELTQLKTYALSTYPPSVRAPLVELALHETDNLGLVIIERIEDLLDGEADEPAINRLVAQLRQWADQLELYLLVIHRPHPAQPHRNRPGEGEWQAQLKASAETILSVRGDTGLQEAYEVWAQVGPEDELGSVVFTIDSTGATRLIDTAPSNKASQGESTRAGSALPVAMCSQLKKALLERAYAHQPRLGYAQLRTRLMEAAQSKGTRLGKTGAERLIHSLVETGYLLKQRRDTERYPQYEQSAEQP